MIYRSRTMTLVPQKSAAVRDVAKRAAAYVNGQYAGIHVEVLQNIAGSQDDLHMVTQCDSLAALEAYEAKRLTDSGWMALVEEVRATEGIRESVDHLYRVVE